MKNMKLLAMPLLAISFLTLGCGSGGSGGGGEDEDAIYKVNKEEFNDAISLKNVRYAQLAYKMGTSDETFGDDKYEMSPTVCYWEKNGQGASKIYSRLNEDGKNVTSDLYQNKEWKSTTKSLEEARTPPSTEFFPIYFFLAEDIAPKVVLDKYELKYSNFEYNSSDKCYHTQIQSEGGKADMSLSFINKKASKVRLNSNDGQSWVEMTYTYNEKIPDDPRPQ